MEDLDDIITELDGKRYGSLSIWERKFVDGLIEGGRMRKVKVGLFGFASNTKLEKVQAKKEIEHEQ